MKSGAEEEEEESRGGLETRAEQCTELFLTQLNKLQYYTDHILTVIFPAQQGGMFDVGL